jgi:hypothetical protein
VAIGGHPLCSCNPSGRSCVHRPQVLDVGRPHEHSSLLAPAEVSPSPCYQSGSVLTPVADAVWIAWRLSETAIQFFLGACIAVPYSLPVPHKDVWQSPPSGSVETQAVNSLAHARTPRLGLGSIAAAQPYCFRSRLCGQGCVHLHAHTRGKRVVRTTRTLLLLSSRRCATGLHRAVAVSLSATFSV